MPHFASFKPEAWRRKWQVASLSKSTEHVPSRSTAILELASSRNYGTC